MTDIQTLVACRILQELGAGGMPFLLPLLYQIGMGYTPVQAALLIVSQPLAAMSLKMTVPRILERFGYRRVLLWNTLAMDGLILSFSAIGPGTAVWQILVQGFMFGFCSSLQYSELRGEDGASVSRRGGGASGDNASP